MDDHPLSPNLGAAYSGNVEAIDYLEWYIPRLQAGVEHDLSQSGMHFHWDWESLLDGVIPENLTDPFKPPLNPRDLIAEREGVDPRRVTGATV